MPDYYTRSGDDGNTGLLGEGRVPKYHPQPEAVGTIDEATAALGLARAACQAVETAPLLLVVQRDLYNMMAEISATPNNAARFRVIDASRVTWLEQQIDATGQSVDVPNEFILPGDSPGGAALALARTIVRRAERRVARLLHDEQISNPALLHYLNRLSSFCFVLELKENQAAGKAEPTLAKE
jgi:cob(I)alamin adenosyltransferase